MTLLVLMCPLLMLEVTLQIYKHPARTGKLSFIYLFSGKSVGQKELEILKLNNGKGNNEKKEAACAI